MEFSIVLLRHLTGIEQKKNPASRKGQTMWIVATLNWPTLANPLRATNVDPYYLDLRIESFLAALEKNNEMEKK